jgi:hypothetical protein
MGVIVAGDYVKVITCCHSTANTQISLNNFFMQALTVSGAWTEQDTASTLETAIAPFYKALMPSTVFWRGLSVQKVQIAPLGVPFPSVASAGAGTYASLVALPNQVSAIISLRTALAGRHYRGRIYPGLVPDGASNQDGQMTAAYQVVLQQLAAYLQAVIGLNAHTVNTTWRVQVRSFFPPVPPLPGNTVFNPVISCTGRTAFATQRRRGQFGRINVLPF